MAPTRTNENELFINHRFRIPLKELEWTYVRSSGPGGQNVNRTNSAALLRWNYLASPSLLQLNPSEEILKKLAALATGDGDLLVKSQTFRDQERNYQECLAKFVSLLKEVFFKPKHRVPTKPSRSSQRKRLQTKKMHSEKKSLRKNRYED